MISENHNYNREDMLDPLAVNVYAYNDLTHKINAHSNHVFLAGRRLIPKFRAVLKNRCLGLVARLRHVGVNVPYCHGRCGSADV